MSDENQREAFELIDAFAARLLELTENKKVPMAWKKYLTAAMKPKPKKSGPIRNLERYKQIVRDVILAGPKPWQERTKHHNPKDCLQEIADQHNVDLRTVRRAKDDYFDYWLECNDLDKERMEANHDGFVEALIERLIKHDEKTKQARRRKDGLPRL